MGELDPAWLSLLLAAVPAVLLFWRVRCPGASRAAERAALLAAVLGFFLVAGLFRAGQSAAAQSGGPNRVQELR
jgi:uncharacterized protein YqgC (DUF456 family)